MNTTARVVVGYDASTESKFAVRWASAAAQNRGAELLVLTASGRGTHEMSWARHRAGISQSMTSQAQEIADEGAALARSFGTTNVRSKAVSAGAVNALVDESDRAQLVVLGDTGRGRLHSALVGSTAFSVAQHAHCPVVVTKSRMNELPSADLPSIVGVDGSDHSLGALDQAASWAQQYGNPLRAVVAWSSRTSLGAEASQEALDNANAVAAGAAKRVAEKFPDLSFEAVVREGRPSAVLAKESEDAGLLVVGARGLGDFASLLIGSVSREVIQHAKCPVYVIR